MKDSRTKIHSFFFSIALAGLTMAALSASWLIGRYPPPTTFSELIPTGNPSVKDASFWKTTCAGAQCFLCPFKCFLPEGTRGRCRVRINSSGRLRTLVWSHPVSVHVDPVEKKPVFHLLPGRWIYSLATVGCNLHCQFCQNWEISQSYPEAAPRETVFPAEVKIFQAPDGTLRGSLIPEKTSLLTPKQVVEAALKTRCAAIAYTYSEPTIFYEYVFETARLAKEKGLKNVMVSAGYINSRALEQLAPYIDVYKVDLKGFDEDFYRKTVGGELRFVLKTLVELKKHGVMTEIVNLLAPTLNDDMDSIRRMARWIHENLGPDVPLFFSRFTPQYRMQNIPPTPVETLEKARRIALDEGLHYVYIGNVTGHEAENTYCPTCHRVLIQRHGYAVLQNLIDKNGRCPYDKTRIPGVWS
ncbi:MAG TPA: AmmeMemoRadiSam system radical SAM enzyme [Elusimicrobiota bacterium]|nr:AmmeMemoRadiSam system radical SAM enzyme [Elusimicrobiota bacterium]